MNELPPIAAAARQLADAGEPGLLATLVGVHGSSYRAAGAMMLVTPAGHRVGGVSGGCLEDYVAREGRRLTLERGGPVVLSFDTSLADDDAASPVPTPGCGGRLEILVEQLTAEHAAWLTALDDCRRKGTRAVLANVIEEADTPGGAVTVRRMAVCRDGITFDSGGSGAKPRCSTARAAR
jgi:xanthine/CO dehydrogenase XdhC/CoxF family maturation factor